MKDNESFNFTSEEEVECNPSVPQPIHIHFEFPGATFIVGFIVGVMLTVLIFLLK